MRPAWLPTEAPRARTLGFDVVELRRALEANGVPHALGALGEVKTVNASTEGTAEATAAIAAEATAAATTAATTAIAAATTDATGGATAPHDSANQSGKLIGKKPPAFRGELKFVLKMAWQNAEDKDSLDAVYQALCDLASQDRPPKPLVGYEYRSGVKYRVSSDPKKICFFTLQDMRNRQLGQRNKKSKR